MFLFSFFFLIIILLYFFFGPAIIILFSLDSKDLKGIPSYVSIILHFMCKNKTNSNKYTLKADFLALCPFVILRFGCLWLFGQINVVSATNLRSWTTFSVHLHFSAQTIPRTPFNECCILLVCSSKLMKSWINSNSVFWHNVKELWTIIDYTKKYSLNSKSSRLFLICGTRSQRSV